MVFEILRNSNTNTDSATFNPSGADQTLATYNVPENRAFGNYNINATISIDSSATAAATQTLNFDVKDGTTTIKTIPHKVVLNTLRFDNLVINVVMPKKTKSAVSIVLRAGTIDAQTSIIVKNFFVAGM